MTDAVSARLPGVYWIGGGSGAGKSSVARHLASTHGLRLYATDDVMAEHARRCRPDDAPFLTAFAAMTMDERWLLRPPEVMLDTFHWYRGEGFELIVDDLLALADGPAVIAEGFRLLPRLVAPLVAVPGRAVWLAPAPQFRRHAFESRGTTWDIAGRTSDPERALSNLLARDRLFTEQLTREATALGLPVIAVDGALTVDELAARVGAVLGLNR